MSMSKQTPSHDHARIPMEPIIDHATCATLTNQVITVKHMLAPQRPQAHESAPPLWLPLTNIYNIIWILKHS